MSRPYWSGGGNNTYADSIAEADDSYDTDALPVEDAEDYEAYGYSHTDNRWRWIAGFAAVVLFVAVVAVASVLNKDSATSSSTSTSASAAPTSVTQDAATPSKPPRTVTATVPPTPAPGAVLAPETVVTLTPTPSAETHPGTPEPPPPAAEAPAPDRTITYTVTGNRQLFDLVTVIYTDEQGFPRTDINVALPWSRTVVLNPGVETKSVTATSLAGQLNCAVSDAGGATLVAQNNNALIATCVQ